MRFAEWAAILLMIAVDNIRARSFFDDEKPELHTSNQLSLKEKNNGPKKISFNVVLDAKADTSRSSYSNQRNAIFSLKNLEMNVEDINENEPKRNYERKSECTTKRKCSKPTNPCTRKTTCSTEYEENEVVGYYSSEMSATTKESFSLSGTTLASKHSKSLNHNRNFSKNKKFNDGNSLKQDSLFGKIDKNVKSSKDKDDMSDESEEDEKLSSDSGFGKKGFYLEKDERESTENIAKSTMSIEKNQEDDENDDRDEEVFPALDSKDKSNSRNNPVYDDDNDDNYLPNENSRITDTQFSEDEQDREEEEEDEPPSTPEAVRRKNKLNGKNMFRANLNLKEMPQKDSSTSEIRFDKEKGNPFENTDSEREFEIKKFRTPLPTVRMKKITTRNFVKNNRKKILQQLKKNDDKSRVPLRDYDRPRKSYVKRPKESGRSDIIANPRYSQTEIYSRRRKHPIISKVKSHNMPSINLKYEPNSFRNPNAPMDILGFYLSTSAPYDKRPSQKCPVEQTNQQILNLYQTSESSFITNISNSGYTDSLADQITTSSLEDMSDFREEQSQSENSAQECTNSNESEENSKEEQVETDQVSDSIEETSSQRRVTQF